MSLKSGILITIQMVAMLFLAIYNTPFVSGFGLIIQGVGALIVIWAIITIGLGNFNIQPEVKSNFLVTRGPYKYIRNPMYLAVFLFFLPLVVKNINWINISIFLILITTLLLKIFSEEYLLEQKFRDDFKIYKKRTWRVIPFIF